MSEDRYKQILSDHLGMPLDLVTDERTLTDLGADSLDAIEVTMAVEDAFGIEVPEDTLDHLPTLTVGESYRKLRTLLDDH